MENDKEFINAEPGTIVDINRKEGYIDVLSGDGEILRILELQPENKKILTVKDWLNGNPNIKIGMKLI